MVNIGNIIGGHVNEFLGLSKDLSEARLEICHKCPLWRKLDFIGEQCNPGLWLNPETGDISREQKDGYFKGCGCRLKAKTSAPESNCPANKW